MLRVKKEWKTNIFVYRPMSAPIYRPNEETMVLPTLVCLGGR